MATSGTDPWDCDGGGGLDPWGLGTVIDPDG